MFRSYRSQVLAVALAAAAMIAAPAAAEPFAAPAGGDLLAAERPVWSDTEKNVGVSSLDAADLPAAFVPTRFEFSHAIGSNGQVILFAEPVTEEKDEEVRQAYTGGSLVF